MDFLEVRSPLRKDASEVPSVGESGEVDLGEIDEIYPQDDTAAHPLRSRAPHQLSGSRHSSACGSLAI